MVISVKHATQAVGTDAGNGEIRKAQWNEAHTIEMATARILGRTTSDAGPVEELSVGAGLLLSASSLAMTGQGLALHELATNGLIARTGAGAVAGRTLTAGTGVAVTNGNGVSGNPTVALSTGAQASLALADTSVQPARAVNTGSGLTGGGDLSTNRTLALTGQALAVHNLGTNGLVVRTGLGTVTSRSITGGAGVFVSQGDGVSANPSVALTGQALAFHNLATNGMVARTTSGAVAARTVTGGTGIAVTNGNGVSGNPTVTLTTEAQASLALADTSVQPARAVNTGTGLTGGGNLSADRTIALDSTTTASLAKADTAVQPARTITAGSGLSGGGDLSADRTLSVASGGVTRNMLESPTLGDSIRVRADTTQSTNSTSNIIAFDVGVIRGGDFRLTYDQKAAGTITVDTQVAGSTVSTQTTSSSSYVTRTIDLTGVANGARITVLFRHNTTATSCEIRNIRLRTSGEMVLVVPLLANLTDIG
jgi:hypothetical protein